MLTQQQMKLVWQLVVALWGNLRSSDAELGRNVRYVLEATVARPLYL